MTDQRVPEDQVNGFVVVVVRPTGCVDEPGADAYGPHGEREAHDIATLAVRAGYPTFLLDIASADDNGHVHAERYTGEETSARHP